ncbi:MAG TPA: sugar phosphate isomerase/epimerase family protein [Fimbriiglobus sp.]|jgi:sugar phosphate isomerase/epimerase
MFPGYNTNGFAHHKLEDAVAILAGQGYRGIALTPDVHHLNPFDPEFPERTEEFRELLDRHGLKCVIETGARFLLDAHRKHQPTLVSPDPGDRAYRLEFLEQDAVGLAAAVGADCVCFWSGTPTDDAPPSEHMARLVEECKKLADAAAARNVRLGFEPEPGMFVDTMDKFAELFEKVNHPFFGLTVDVGHLVCQGEAPVSNYLLNWKDVLWNVHLDDMRRGVHDHLMFGEGEVDFADVFAGLTRAGYAGGVYVELSRHSHDAVNAARKSVEFIKSFLAELQP